MQAVNDCELVPQADPNTASHTQRVMKIMALKQLQQQNPAMYDPKAIDMAALKAMGWSNPEQFMVPAETQQQVPPEVQKAMAELQILKQEADAKTAVAQASVQESQVDGQARLMDAETKRILAQAKLQETQAKSGVEAPRGEDPWRQVDAEAKMMDAETRRILAELKAADLGLNVDKMQMESDHREADRILDSHHRAADRATQLAKNINPVEGE
jgi:hypothetical protein